MNIVDIVLLVAIIALVIYCGYKGLGHFRGESGCCGGGSTTVKEEDKKLSGEIIGKYTLNIDGMSCEHCTDRVKHAINLVDHASGSVSLRKKEAVVYYDQDIDINEVINKIDAAGYIATLKA